MNAIYISHLYVSMNNRTFCIYTAIDSASADSPHDGGGAVSSRSSESIHAGGGAAVSSSSEKRYLDKLLI